MSSRKECKIRINNDDICILHNENGTRIFNNANHAQLENDLIYNVGKCLDYCSHYCPQERKLLFIEESISIYNRLIESSEIIQMIQYILPSSVLTLNILNHPKEEIELNNQIVERLKRFKSLVEFISEYHKHKNDFSGQWKNILDIITILTNFKENIDHTSTTHLCVDLYPRTEERDFEIQENQYFGSIVFIDSNSRFSFRKKESFIGIGITNKNSSSFSESHSSIPIHVFGNCLVRVVYPRHDCVDERGMFVILNKNQEENTGIGEIISFEDLIHREANSYHLVGICSLDKTEQPNSSLYLFSPFSHTSRITHPSNDYGTCFVLMISLPMSYSLVQMLLQNTPLVGNKKFL